jgi:hypothetical protein
MTCPDGDRAGPLWALEPSEPANAAGSGYCRAAAKPDGLGSPSFYTATCARPTLLQRLRAPQRMRTPDWDSSSPRRNTPLWTGSSSSSAQSELETKKKQKCP